MREIKFRGLTSDNEFVYGDIHYDAPNETLYYKEYSQRLVWFEGNAHCNRPVKNGTIGQYTGLKDKNGVEIYEGDIVLSGHTEKVSEVKFGEFNDPAFEDRSTSIGFYFGHEPVPFGKDASGSTDEYEVLGNIYQHPELLTPKS